MQSSSFHYLPLTPVVFVALLFVWGVLVAALQIGILGYAYEKMGLSGRWVYGLLALSLLGSYVNIPVAELPAGEQVVNRVYTTYNDRYVVPEVHRWPATIVALNVGGAIIPTALSFYLMWRNEIFLRGILGMLLVAIVVHTLAQPVQGKGISVPIFLPPICAALAGMLLSREAAAPLAYVAGSLGTLLGADLMNLHRLAEIGASIASIGGAGTFDGIFLAGILAALLAH